MLFGEEILISKLYTTSNALHTINQIQLIDPKKFVIAALDVNSKLIMMYMAIQERENMAKNPVKKAQIEA